MTTPSSDPSSNSTEEPIQPSLPDPDNLEGPGPSDEERRLHFQAVHSLHLREKLALMRGEYITKEGLEIPPELWDSMFNVYSFMVSNNIQKLGFLQRRTEP
jgi:hypothetical protein